MTPSLAPPCNGPFSVPIALVIAEYMSERVAMVTRAENVEALKDQLRSGAKKQYAVQAVVDKYMNCIEEVINIPMLREHLRNAIKQGYLRDIINEIVRQSKVEFNYEEADDDDE